MAGPLKSHGTQPPARRLRQRPYDGYFYPREVASILGIDEIDYYQLRRLFALVREQAGVPVHTGWSRYTLTDIAALKTAVRLCGGVEALRPGRRLQIVGLERACQALRAHGVANPLLDVELVRDGRRVFAVIGGHIFDPASGQQALTETFGQAIQHLAKTDLTGVEGALVKQLRVEGRRRAKRSPAHARTGEVLVTSEPGRGTAAETG